MQHGKCEIVQKLHVFKSGFQLNGLDLMKMSLTTHTCAVPWQFRIDRLYAVTNLKQPALEKTCPGNLLWWFWQADPRFLNIICKGDLENLLGWYLFIAVDSQALFLEVLLDFLVPFMWIFFIYWGIRKPASLILQALLCWSLTKKVSG